jgi:hypothetical protein
MTRIILAWTATAIILACGGGSGGGGTLRSACTKICDCLEDTSNSFSNSGGATCVDDCVGSSGSFSNSGAELSQECLACINTASCPALLDGQACSAECNF